MLVYYLVFVLSFLLCGLDYIKIGYVKIAVYVVFCAFLIMLPALKSVGVDNDSINYVDIFNISNNYSLSDIISGNYWENIERGYMLLNKVTGLLGGNVHLLFFIVALLTGVLNYTFFYKMSPYPFTTLLFYLSFFYLYRDFTQIRYGLSCSIAFWSVYFLLKKEYLGSIVGLFLALLFHNTAFILFLILPIILLIKNKYLYFVIPFFCVVGIFYNPFPILLSLGGVPEHMLIYLDEPGGGGFMISAMGLIIMSIYIVFNQKFSDDWFDYGVYYRLFAVGVSLNLLFIQSSIFQRFSHMFFQFGILLLPNLLSQLHRSNDKYYFLLIHFLFICFFLYYGIKMVEPGLIRPYF